MIEIEAADENDAARRIGDQRLAVESVREILAESRGPWWDPPMGPRDEPPADNEDDTLIARIVLTFLRVWGGLFVILGGIATCAGLFDASGPREEWDLLVALLVLIAGCGLLTVSVAIDIDVRLRESRLVNATEKKS